MDNGKTTSTHAAPPNSHQAILSSKLMPHWKYHERNPGSLTLSMSDGTTGCRYCVACRAISANGGMRSIPAPQRTSTNTAIRNGLIAFMFLLLTSEVRDAGVSPRSLNRFVGQFVVAIHDGRSGLKGSVRP